MRTPIGSPDAHRFNDGELAQDLVPLGLATRTIGMKIYGRNASASQLTDLARAVAARAALYTHNSDGTDIRRLTHEELHCGCFRKAGGELDFPNGDPPIVNIAVAHQAIELVVAMLASAAGAEDRRLD